MHYAICIVFRCMLNIISLNVTLRHFSFLEQVLRGSIDQSPTLVWLYPSPRLRRRTVLQQDPSLLRAPRGHLPVVLGLLLGIVLPLGLEGGLPGDLHELVPCLLPRLRRQLRQHPALGTQQGVRTTELYNLNIDDKPQSLEKGVHLNF